MTDSDKRTRAFVYHGTLPGWVGLLLAPLLLVFFSLVATLLAGGAVVVFVLPLFFRRWLRGPSRPADTGTIELDQTQYTRVESPARQQLPNDSARGAGSR